MLLFPFLEVKKHDFRFTQILVLAEIVNNSAVSRVKFLWSRPFIFSGQDLSFKLLSSVCGWVCVCACLQIIPNILNLTSLFQVIFMRLQPFYFTILRTNELREVKFTLMFEAKSVPNQNHFSEVNLC